MLGSDFNQNLFVVYSDSSLEVLLQHLSLQDVDAPDNEVCTLRQNFTIATMLFCYKSDQ